MSGSGRKTSYRKGVTKKVLYDAPEPKENEQIVRVTGLRGSNLFEVQDEHGVSTVTMLPTKFRKLIWIKRGDFLIVSSGDEAAEASTAKGKKKAAVTSIVENILYKDQIKNLKAKNLWPEAFETVEQPAVAATDDGGDANTDVDVDAAAAGTAASSGDGEAKPAPAKTNNGITMLDTSFANMMSNRNRRHHMFDEDEDEDEDSD